METSTKNDIEPELSLENIKKMAHDQGFPFLKSKRLGEYLSIPPHILDTFEHDCADSDELFSKVINYCLNNFEDFSWCKLAEAMEYCDHKKIANHIRKFSTSIQDTDDDKTSGNHSKHPIADLIEINEPCKNGEVHGVITVISPFKRGRKTSYFDGEIADSTNYVRLVGFDDYHRKQLNYFHKSKFPVKITNCEIKKFKQGSGFNIVLNKETEIEKSSKTLNMDDIHASFHDTAEIVPLDTVPHRKNYDRVSVNIKVLKLCQIEEVNVKHTKQLKRDVIVADQSASIKVVLWEKSVHDLQEGKSYSLQNFLVREYQSVKHLSMSKTESLITSIGNIETDIITSTTGCDALNC